MKRVALRISLLCLTSTGAAWAQDPAAPLAAGAAPAPSVAPAPAVAPAVAPAGAPAGAPAVAPAAVAPAAAPLPPPVPIHYLPKTRPYRDDAPPPEHYILSDEPRRGLVIGGIVAIGAPYISGLLIAGAAMDFPNKSAFLAVPVAGPWLTLATRDTCEDSGDVFDCTDDEIARRVLLFDGIIQALGTALLVTGFTWTKTVWLREDLADNIQFMPGLNVARLPGDSPQGASVVGRF